MNRQNRLSSEVYVGLKSFPNRHMKKLNEFAGLFLDERHPRIMKFKEGVAFIWKRNKPAKEEMALRRTCSESALSRDDLKRLGNANSAERRGVYALLNHTSATLRRSVKVEQSPVRTRHEIIPVKSCLRQEPQGTPCQDCKRVTFSTYALILSAASQNAVSELRGLLDEKPSYINKPSSSGETALHKAAAKGSLECITLLLQRGGNVNLADKQGRTPLLIAWENGHFDCHKLMLRSLKQSLDCD